MSSDSSDPPRKMFPNLNERVFRSELIRCLAEKQQTDGASFSFLAELERLSRSIAPHLSDTRILFPEFTPHDEELHIVGLFQLSDTLFGKHVFAQMNAAELFILACGLYTHDWGMAVSADEQDYLRQGAPEDLLSEHFAPIDHEKDRLAAFAGREGFHAWNGRAFPLPNELLRQYVRDTHALRSGARTRRHFESNSAVGQAVAHVAEGHWHDFAVLDDPSRFPREYGVAGSTVQLLAITLQLRLIDLFHITEDRTPYVLWRFVNPRDSRSAEEWKKHRALTAVRVRENSPTARSILVQGTTDDGSVWAALEDLRRYCEDQITGTFQVSARHVPQLKYGLNFVRLEWQVTTGQLRPISFRFSFDRNAMFEILSSQIYGGDPYVFLRELLQNSIDAIRTRRAKFLQRKIAGFRKQIDYPHDPTIYFTAEHRSNGDVLVTCRDYGIGMDEHIVRNYFTVAGVSYYRSSEFARQGLGFEPISRFGIGVLSCFMVSDTLEVLTYRDPELGPPMLHNETNYGTPSSASAYRMHVCVPRVDRQFVVKNVSNEFEVGTEVRVHARAEKIRKQCQHASPDQSEGPPGLEFHRTLEVTEHLIRIAGFVEFPILITETIPGAQPRHTLILHPRTNAKEWVIKYTCEPEIQQLSSRFPWHLAVSEKSIAEGKQVAQEFVVDLPYHSADNFEGWFTCIIPKDSDMYFEWERDGVRALSRGMDEQIGHFEWNASCDCQRIYSNGILLDRDSEMILSLGNDRRNQCWMCINLPSLDSFRTNASRSELESRSLSWLDSIWEMVRKKVQHEYETKLLASPLSERLYLLGWLVASLGFANICDSILSSDRLPVPYLVSPGRVAILEGAGKPGEDFVSCCESLEDDCLLLLQDCIAFRESRENWTWLGERYLIQIPRIHVNKHEPVTQYLSHLLSPLLLNRAELKSLDFVRGPKLRQGDSVLELPRFSWKQAGYSHITAEFNESDLLQRAVTNPELLSQHEIVFIWHLGAKLTHHTRTQTLVEFSAPFEECITSSYLFVNAKHPLVRLAVQGLAAAMLGEARGQLRRSQSRAIRNLVYGHNFLQWTAELIKTLRTENLLPQTEDPTMANNINVPNLHIPGRWRQVPSKSFSSATLLGEIGSSLLAV